MAFGYLDCFGLGAFKRTAPLASHGSLMLWCPRSLRARGALSVVGPPLPFGALDTFGALMRRTLGSGLFFFSSSFHFLLLHIRPSALTIDIRPFIEARAELVCSMQNSYGCSHVRL